MSRKPIQLLTKRVLHIDSEERYVRQPKDLEERAKGAIARTYLEEEPTIRQWSSQLVPTRQGAANYVRSLFPFATWIRRYNFHWMVGDAIAGLTIGFVVVPQAMAYALLANLSPEYGLYTSFIGAALYWLFGTSKDIVIGTTAVGSLLVGRVITHVSEEKPGVYTHEEIAKALSVIAGVILIILGLFRLGWIIEFIPYVSISAFVTAASITIMSTQLPVALGIRGINTREAPHLVLIHTFKALGKTKSDAAIGLTSIALLSLIRGVCAKMEVRQPLRKRMWATISSLRLAFAILLYTFISWLAHRNTPVGEYKFRIVGKIEPGFKHAKYPKLDTDLLGMIIPELPAIVIILVIEHIAIAKSFGRIFNYTITPSQEILAQGVANFFGPFVGGYVCTGSFGASAVLSKAGVRTPLAGLFSAMILVLALYALTALFKYIPMAALAGLIIHATSNLLTPPKALYKYWQLSPFELLIWIVGVILALFESLEMSIYATIGLSFALSLVRLARTKGRFLGQVHIYRVTSDNSQDKTVDSDGAPSGAQEKSVDVHSSTDSEGVLTSRNAFLPLDRKDSSNPDIKVDSPYPGVFIYRFGEGFNYINQAQHIDHLLSHILKVTRRTTADDEIKATDRLWNDPGPSPGHGHAGDTRPFLRAVVLECASVNNMDITSAQGLIDLRNTLDRYAAPAAVEWHFAGILNRWTRRTLAVAGFGYPSADNPDELGHWSPAYTVASSLAGATDDDTRRAAAFDTHDEEKDNPHENAVSGDKKKETPKEATTEGAETESQSLSSGSSNGTTAVGHERLVPVYGVDRPFFHIDLVDAVDAAMRDARRKDQERTD